MQVNIWFRQYFQNELAYLLGQCFFHTVSSRKVPPPAMLRQMWSLLLPASPSQPALLCWELSCEGRSGAGGAAAVQHRCLWSQTWSMMLSSRASPFTANRYWWCVLLHLSRMLTHTTQAGGMLWRSFTGGGTSRGTCHVPRCEKTMQCIKFKKGNYINMMHIIPHEYQAMSLIKREVMHHHDHQVVQSAGILLMLMHFFKDTSGVA